MSELTDPFYNRKQLIDIAIENQMDEKYHYRFIEMIGHCMQELYDDNDSDESDRGVIAVRQTLAEMRFIILELEKGHSESWAIIYSLSFAKDSEKVLDTFYELRRDYPNSAREQLSLHVKSLGKDDLYNKHLIFIINEGSYKSYSGLLEEAQIFSKTFKQQKDIGKSDLFVEKYSELIAEGNCGELYAFSFATLQEEAIVDGKSEGFAYKYAKELANYVSSNYKNFDEALGDEFFKLKISEVVAALAKY